MSYVAVVKWKPNAKNVFYLYERTLLLLNCVRTGGGMTSACTFAMTSMEREWLRGMAPTEQNDDVRRRVRWVILWEKNIINSHSSSVDTLWLWTVGKNLYTYEINN